MKQVMVILLILGLVIAPYQEPRKFSHLEELNLKAFLEYHFRDGIFNSSESENTIDGTASESPQYDTKELKVCSSSSSKTYMDWLKTSATSRQGKFMREKMTVRDGLLYSNDGFIGVALGSYFGVIGDKFIFTLDTGIVLHLIKVEEKSDRHVINGCEHKQDRSVIEFVIDMATHKFPYFSNKYIANGNFNNLEQFRGSIIKVEKVIDSGE